MLKYLRNRVALILAASLFAMGMCSADEATKSAPREWQVGQDYFLIFEKR